MNAKNRLRAGLGLLESCLADVNERWGQDAENRTTMSFDQVWGSTSLAFGGFGGAAMTTATTVIFEDPNLLRCAVYVAGRHAYDVNVTDAKDERTRRFTDDKNKKRIQGVHEARRQYSLIQDPLKIINIPWGIEKYGRDDLYVKFKEPIRFTPAFSQDGTKIVMAREDLGVIIEMPWDNDTWNDDAAHERLKKALGMAWVQHVEKNSGRDNVEIRKNLMAVGTTDVSFNNRRNT